MLRNYLITALRFLAKNHLFTAINSIGLAVSIACTMFIYLYIKNELTYDEFHKDIQRLYVLGEGSREGREDEPSYYQTVYPALPAMLEQFPEIETGSRYFDWEGRILLAGDKKFMHQVHYVDSTFLQTLSFAMIEGTAETALQKNNSIVVNRAIALKLFNTTDILGQTIALENGEQYSVTGVLGDVPSNSSIQPEVLLTLAQKETDEEFRNMGNWYNTIAQVVIKLKPHADPDKLRAKLPAFVKQHYDESAKERTLKIFPLADLRQSQADNETYIYGLTSIGIFILLVAIINFMNLSIAGSLKRLRETGLRKVMGSSKSSIVWQFFLEAFILTVASVIVSIGMVQLTLPFLNAILEMKLNLTMKHLADAALLLTGLVFIVALMAGGYPAFYLSNYKTVAAVKGIIPNYQRRLTLRNSLVVIQFIVSVTLIIAVIVTSRQIYFMKTADLKFNRENVMVITLDGGFKDEKTSRVELTGLVNELKSRADILSVSLSQNVPGRYWGNYNRFNKEDGLEGVSLRKAYVDDQYLNTYGIKVLAGGNFTDLYADSAHAVMLNASAVKALGWTTAVGKTLKENGDDHIYTVVGVFDDFHYRSLDGVVEPLIHFYFDKVEHANFISLRLAPLPGSEVITELQNKWAALDSWLGFNYFFVDEEFNKQYKGVERTLLLIGIFTGVAIIISCAGIFALSAINAQQRTKEIGIRKVLGASVPNIVVLLSKDYFKLVVIAIVIGGPVAAFGMSQWLKEFAYKIELEWWIFAIAGAMGLMIAFLTTGYQSMRAAMHNPTKSLHTD